jgi:hypothetical protein
MIEYLPPGLGGIVSPKDNRPTDQPDAQSAVPRIRGPMHTVADEKFRKASTSIELFLNQEIFRSSTNILMIHEALVAGRLVLIREAIHAAFAERMFQCLDQFTGWKVYEKYEEFFAQVGFWGMD